MRRKKKQEETVIETEKSEKSEQKNALEYSVSFV